MAIARNSIPFARRHFVIVIEAISMENVWKRNGVVVETDVNNLHRHSTTYFPLPFHGNGIFPENP